MKALQLETARRRLSAQTSCLAVSSQIKFYVLKLLEREFSRASISDYQADQYGVKTSNRPTARILRFSILVFRNILSE